MRVKTIFGGESCSSEVASFVLSFLLSSPCCLITPRLFCLHLCLGDVNLSSGFQPAPFLATLADPGSLMPAGVSIHSSQCLEVLLGTGATSALDSQSSFLKLRETGHYWSISFSHSLSITFSVIIFLFLRQGHL